MKTVDEMTSTYKKSDHYEFAMHAFCTSRGMLVVSSRNWPSPCDHPKCGLCNQLKDLFNKSVYS
jgi:hypothetical protein